MPVTKSRSARVGFALFAAACATPAFADPPTTAEETARAYERWFDDATGGVARRQVGRATRCRGDAENDEIVVCGRGESESYRIPYVPEDGARTRMVAGEAPGGTGALSVGDSCCDNGASLNLLAIGGALLRGADRILHPD